MSDTPTLVADIGATNARFGLIDATGTLLHSAILPCAGHPGLAEAAASYLAAAGPAASPRSAAVAIAGPVVGETIRMTNHPWSFSRQETCRALGLDRLVVVNDFTAVALAVPLLRPEDREQVGGGEAVAGETIGVLGPGSGLGVSGLVPMAGGLKALSGEGGHVTMAAADAREDAVLAQLRTEFGHVSAERVVSGMGLPNLYRALSRVDGRQPEPLTAAEVTERALAGQDDTCIEALAMFCAMLGTVAGNLALTLGARGGIYIAGGIVPRFLPFLKASRFRERFLAKGRLSGYLEPMPTFVVTHKLPAFLGLKAALDAPLV